jgi:hypothetical protein
MRLLINKLRDFTDNLLAFLTKGRNEIQQINLHLSCAQNAK